MYNHNRASVKLIHYIYSCVYLFAGPLYENFASLENEVRCTFAHCALLLLGESIWVEAVLNIMNGEIQYGVGSEVHRKYFLAPPSNAAAL